MIQVEETDLRFYIKESTIPNAGFGLFANQNLEKGDFLEIIGVLVKTGGLADRSTHYARSYKFGARPGDKPNMLVVPLGYGGIVNHAPDIKSRNAVIDMNNGPTRNSAAGKIVYRFTRRIAKDEEILGDYGEYWGEAFKWAAPRAKIIDESQDVWDKFLSYDLYGLGQLNK